MNVLNRCLFVLVICSNLTFAVSRPYGSDTVVYHSRRAGIIGVINTVEVTKVSDQEDQLKVHEVVFTFKKLYKGSLPDGELTAQVWESSDFDWDSLKGKLGFYSQDRDSKKWALTRVVEATPVYVELVSITNDAGKIVWAEKYVSDKEPTLRREAFLLLEGVASRDQHEEKLLKLLGPIVLEKSRYDNERLHALRIMTMAPGFKHICGCRSTKTLNFVISIVENKDLHLGLRTRASEMIPVNKQGRDVLKKWMIGEDAFLKKIATDVDPLPKVRAISDEKWKKFQKDFGDEKDFIRSYALYELSPYWGDPKVKKVLMEVMNSEESDKLKRGAVGVLAWDLSKKNTDYLEAIIRDTELEHRLRWRTLIEWARKVGLSDYRLERLKVLAKELEPGELRNSAQKYLDEG